MKVYELNWWQHNRGMTLVRTKKDESVRQAGIYMRRRLATPLVAPVRVDEEEDCEVLEQLFSRYVAKAGKQEIII